MTLLNPGLMGANAGFDGSGLGETTAVAVGAGAAAAVGAGAAATVGAGSEAGGKPFSWVVRSEAGATLTGRPLELDFVKASGITILLRGPSLGLAVSLLVLPASAIIHVMLLMSVAVLGALG